MEKVLLAAEPGIDSAWINCKTEQLTQGSCSLDVYKMVWLTPKYKKLDTWLPDLVFWMTMFIWTVVLASLVISWLKMIMWGADEQHVKSWRDGVKNALIWLLLVWLSYAIIRVIQILAKWT